MSKDMRRKILTMNKKIGMGIIAIALIVGIAACGVHRGPHHMDQAKMLKRISAKLDLNEGQQSKVQVLLENASNFRNDMQTLHSDFSGKLTETLQSPEIDVEALNVHFDEFEADFSTFRKTMVADYAEFHTSLDDAQREILVKQMERMKKHRHH